MFLAMTGVAILRGVGAMKMQMYVMVISALINIVLDPIFIFGLNMGVQGAALATVIARISGCFIIFWYLLKGKTVIALAPKDFNYGHSKIKQILRVGLPSSLSQVSMSIGWGAMAKIASLFGPVAIAALGIGFRIDMVAILPTLGLGIAIITIVGQNVGAGLPERAKESTLNAIGMGAAYLLILSTVFFLFPEPIIKIFNSDPLLVSYTTLYIRTIAPAYFFVAIGMMVGSAILGTGRPMAYLIITVIRVLVLSVPLAYLFSVVLEWGVIGMWWGITLAKVFQIPNLPLSP